MYVVVTYLAYSLPLLYHPGFSPVTHLPLLPLKVLLVSLPLLFLFTFSVLIPSPPFLMPFLLSHPTAREDPEGSPLKATS